MKYELIIPFVGQEVDAIEWAMELQQEWDTKVIVNEINDNDEFVRSIDIPDKVLDTERQM